MVVYNLISCKKKSLKDLQYEQSNWFKKKTRGQRTKKCPGKDRSIF